MMEEKNLCGEVRGKRLKLLILMKGNQSDT